MTIKRLALGLTVVLLLFQMRSASAATLSLERPESTLIMSGANGNLGIADATRVLHSELASRVDALVDLAEFDVSDIPDGLEIRGVDFTAANLVDYADHDQADIRSAAAWLDSDQSRSDLQAVVERLAVGGVVSQSIVDLSEASPDLLIAMGALDVLGDIGKVVLGAIGFGAAVATLAGCQATLCAAMEIVSAIVVVVGGTYGGVTWLVNSGGDQCEFTVELSGPYPSQPYGNQLIPLNASGRVLCSASPMKSNDTIVVTIHGDNTVAQRTVASSGTKSCSGRTLCSTAVSASTRVNAIAGVGYECFVPILDFFTRDPLGQPSRGGFPGNQICYQK